MAFLWAGSRPLLGGLLDLWREKAYSGGSPSARGCAIDVGRKMAFLGGSFCLGLRARLREGGGGFWGNSDCCAEQFD